MKNKIANYLKCIKELSDDFLNASDYGGDYNLADVQLAIDSNDTDTIRKIFHFLEFSSDIESGFVKISQRKIFLKDRDNLAIYHIYYDFFKDISFQDCVTYCETYTEIFEALEEMQYIQNSFIRYAFLDKFYKGLNTLDEIIKNRKKDILDSVISFFENKQASSVSDN